ncbi:protein madd-4-like [Littorina saxatilis]|uniref:protein madd-4-like n=1 Tax=Littorina saxatilis TaxID=31220 RepID=UPI0038B6ADE1
MSAGLISVGGFSYLQSDDSNSFLPPSPEDDLFKTHFGDLFSDQVPSLPKFDTGDWSACSVTCGQGTRSRDVTCSLFNAVSKKEDTFPDAECFGKKPESMTGCNERQCSGDLPLLASANEVHAGVSKKSFYRWYDGDFTDCSQSCRGGTHESKVKCVDSTNDQEVSPALCSGLKKPAVVVKPCNVIPCPPRWDIGDYGTCSEECGGGVMRRSVRCVQKEADDTLTQVEDFRCPDPVPKAETTCNNVYCAAHWATDKWNKCSQTCGIGTQTRRVYCVKEPVRGHRVTVSDTECFGPRPATSRQCSVRDCPEDIFAPPVIKAENYTFIQLRRAKKVKLNVGGKVILLPGQSITIRCPVKNYHRRLIFWSKRFKLIPMVGRVRATFNGNLKIRKANPVADTATYTCMAGAQSADVRVEFLSRKDALEKIKDVNHYLKDDPSRSAIVLKPGEPRYQDGVFQDGGYNVTKKFVFMADDWSPCSVTCGSGHQKRRVTCTRVTRKYVKILPERECKKLGLEKPEDMRKCSPQGDCPQWKTTHWSKCTLENCVRDGYAERRRKLHCAFSNGTSALSHLCDKKHMPETARQCVNIDCISHWTTSKWTSCRPSCGTRGSKIRMLTCTWRKTGLPAWAACRFQPRPTVKKTCKLRPCPTAKPTKCADNSRYCSLARMLKMCRYDDFRRKCCRSCTDYLQSTLS